MLLGRLGLFLRWHVAVVVALVVFVVVVVGAMMLLVDCLVSVC